MANAQDSCDDAHLDAGGQISDSCYDFTKL